MATLAKPLTTDLGRLLNAGTMETKRDIVAQHPGLQSPQVCLTLCEQAEEEFLRGNFADGMVFVRILKLIFQVICGVRP